MIPPSPNVAPAFAAVAKAHFIRSICSVADGQVLSLDLSGTRGGQPPTDRGPVGSSRAEIQVAQVVVVVPAWMLDQVVLVVVLGRIKDAGGRQLRGQLGLPRACLVDLVHQG